MPRVIAFDFDYNVSQERIKFPDIKVSDFADERNEGKISRVHDWILEFKRTMRWKLDDFIPNAFDADCVNLEADYVKWEGALSTGQFRKNFIDYLVSNRDSTHPDSRALEETIDLQFCYRLRSTSVRRDTSAQYALAVEKFKSFCGESGHVVATTSSSKIDSNANRLHDCSMNSEEAYECEIASAGSDVDSSYADSSSTSGSFTNEDCVQTRLPNGEYCMRPLSDLAEYFISEATRLLKEKGDGKKGAFTHKAARRAFRAACRSFKEDSFTSGNSFSCDLEPISQAEVETTVCKSDPISVNATSTLQRTDRKKEQLPPVPVFAEPKSTAAKPQVTRADTTMARKNKAAPSNQTIIDETMQTSVAPGIGYSTRRDRFPIYQSTPFFTAPYAASGAPAPTLHETTHSLRSRRVHPSAK